MKTTAVFLLPAAGTRWSWSRGSWEDVHWNRVFIIFWWRPIAPLGPPPHSYDTEYPSSKPPQWSVWRTFWTAGLLGPKHSEITANFYWAVTVQQAVCWELCMSEGVSFPNFLAARTWICGPIQASRSSVDVFCRASGKIVCECECACVLPPRNGCIWCDSWNCCSHLVSFRRGSSSVWTEQYKKPEFFVVLSSAMEPPCL